MDRTYEECRDILLEYFTELFSYKCNDKDLFSIKKFFYKRYLKNIRRFNRFVKKNYEFNLRRGWII